ncbi:type I methionyl aminopeptidase [Candidatus Woesebacteria bacterium]|nr:type I methionyl aminopeptidase [Candidatus Woesebacteria bacterium]
MESSIKITAMTTGGEKLNRVKNALKAAIKPGVSALEIEKLAQDLIAVEGAQASFKMVPGYKWATCINVNEGLVHGIPKKEIIFEKGDVVSVDIGIYYKGYHTDTAFTVGLEVDEKTKRFLEIGEKALREAVEGAKVGNRIYDISEVIQTVVEKGGFYPIRSFVGHTVGKKLHEQPQIPCFVQGERAKSPEIKEGMTLAVEVMYAQGDPNVVRDPDGWTIYMANGKISALFEDTVAVVKNGPKVLT